MKRPLADGVGRPLHELLIELSERARRTSHPLGRYADAFEGSDWMARSLIAIGGDSVVFRLTDSRILHITNKILSPEVGTRFFDLPILERGAHPSSGGIWIYFFLQPEAQTPVSERAFRDFMRAIKTKGWIMSDPSQHQLGAYEGETKLVDPFAVERMPFWNG